MLIWGCQVGNVPEFCSSYALLALVGRSLDGRSKS